MREQAVVCKNGAQRYRKRSTAGFSDLPRWMAVAIPAPSGAAHDIQTLCSEQLDLVRQSVDSDQKDAPRN